MTKKKGKKSLPVFIEVQGGSVSSVKNCRQQFEVIDWDALFDSGDSKGEWEKLSRIARKFIKSEYSESFDKIQDRIAFERKHYCQKHTHVSNPRCKACKREETLRKS